MSTVKDPEMNTGEPNALSEAAHKVLLFYFGVLATAIEESYGWVERLAEQRQRAEQEGRRRLQAALDRRKEAAQQMGDEASKRIEGARSRMILPSRQDIQALDAQITRLAQQIDEIRS